MQRSRENTIPPGEGLEQGELARLNRARLAFDGDVRRSRSMVIPPMTVVSSTGDALFDRSATSRIAMRAIDRSASCATSL